MRRALLLASTAVLALTGAAAAADLGRLAPVVPSVISAQVPAWTGFYAGAHLGYGFGGRFDSNLPAFGPAFNSRFITEPAGVFGGVQLGYDWQMGAFVAGAAGDFSLSGIRRTVPAVAPGVSARGELPWFGSARLRAGVLAGNDFLVYVTGGLAFAQAKATILPAGVNQSRSHIGWTLGVGGEYRVTSNVSAFAEYRYTDFRPENYATIGARIGHEGHSIRAGVNWRFGGAETVVRAAY